MHHMFILENGTPLVVREAVYNDAVFINQLVAQIYGSTNQVLTSLEEFSNSITLNAQLSRIKNYSDSRGKLLLVAEIDKKLVGTLDFWDGQRQRVQHTGEFGMGVLPGFRDQGIGKCLIDVLLLWAKENPIIEKVKLGVFASNERGIHLYEKMGFVEEGRKVAEIKMADGNYFDVIEMYKLVK
jgi:RimJ/RimL family protein N-acetyltransferase